MLRSIDAEATGETGGRAGIFVDSIGVRPTPGHTFLTTTEVYTHIVDDELENAMRGFRNGERG